MSWEYQKSLKRVQHHLGSMGRIETTKLTREANLEELLAETVCREIYGAHVYVDISNFAHLASQISSDPHDYKRLIQEVHIYQRLVTEIVQRVGGYCVHFQGAKLHALLYRPLRQHPKLASVCVSGDLASRAVLLQLLLQDFVQAVFNPAFSHNEPFTIAGGTDLGNAIGTSDGIKGDRELLFLGSPANYAAKIISSANRLRLTQATHTALPGDLQKLCQRVGKDKRGLDLYQLLPVASQHLDALVKSQKLTWRRDEMIKRVKEEQQRFPLSRIVYSSANTSIDLDSLSIFDNKRVVAASLFADVSGFTDYIDTATTERKKRSALRAFHAIRKEMALVVKEDYKGLRIQYQGDRVQGLFHLPQDNPAAITAKAVQAAIGLQSSMQHVLHAHLPETGELQLKVGVDLGTTLISRLGIRGQRDRICLGEAVERADMCEERCEGNQIGITKHVRDRLPDDLQKYFTYDKKAQCYTASLVYEK
jgi:class 3 adenylate cyclase